MKVIQSFIAWEINLKKHLYEVPFCSLFIGNSPKLRFFPVLRTTRNIGVCLSFLLTAVAVSCKFLGLSNSWRCCNSSCVFPYTNLKYPWSLWCGIDVINLQYCSLTPIYLLTILLLGLLSSLNLTFLQLILYVFQIRVL